MNAPKMARLFSIALCDCHFDWPLFAERGFRNMYTCPPHYFPVC